MTDAARDRRVTETSVGSTVAAPGRRPLKWLGPVLLTALGAAVLALVLGFVGFARGIAGAALPVDVRADGIVVLTGGTARIDGALQLLVEGRGKRLLISGVNPSVTREALGLTLSDELRAVLECCVDLDHEAQNTIGNAVEARQWADERGFSSLIVVTSDYHMPRSMAELAEAMPGKRLIPFPVSNPDLHLADWWRDPDAFALLVREYSKFLLAEGRLLVAPALPEGLATKAGTPQP